MQEIIISNSTEVQRMGSREIAELTGKEHKHIIRDIREMMSQIDGPVLDHEEYQELKDNRGYTSEIFLGKELSLTLVSGYSILLRRNIIKRWQELENQVLKSEPMDELTILERSIYHIREQRERLIAVEKTIEGQAVQLEEVNDDIAMVVKEIEGVKKLVLDSSISLEEIYADENAFFEIGEVAGMLIGSGYFSKEKDFRLYLLEKRLCYKHGQNHYYPMARLLKEGYVKVIPVKVGTRVFSATHFTPRGVGWIVKRLQKEQQRELDLGYVESDSVPVLVDSSPTTVVRGF